MICNYGYAHWANFPRFDNVLSTLDYGDVAIIREIGTEYDYILCHSLTYWTRLDNLTNILSDIDLLKQLIDAEWKK